MENKKVQMEEVEVSKTEQKEATQEYQGNVNYFGCGRFSDEYTF
ncbi:MAG: hypothetical protein N4A62_00645 [Marinisporobacter sp.]|nr:hypothetical protein [Marinisporobacter sp.]